MGIPKFFRFMSERYPLISQLVEENKIPEFDNLYLDMNGIIHNCSHPNDGDAHFRMSEADMFLAIFCYIEHIFAKIKPQKVFFLAIDGVAPRAKMNQQRSRRFRTAQEAKELRDKALRRGEELPEEEAFDSNCITPGTPFMARLSQQLKYFLAKKVTEDAMWQGVEIVLSGHDVPGEGEHKIMEYIRLAKAQPDYNNNVRHCLYGLDADLIMLGLLSHDPHFALLREEVSFGPSRKRKQSLELQNFFLLHLSLFREYLDLEFQEVRATIPFEYSLERIIDDFILLNIFVGNDFLPHLPGLHINEGAIDALFRIYVRILPRAGGYINQDGVLRTDRLALVLEELSLFEKEVFEEQFGDAAWAKQKAKKANKQKGKTIAAAKVSTSMTAHQKLTYEKVKGFVTKQRKSPAEASKEMFLDRIAKPNDRQFLLQLAADLGLEVSFDEYNPETDAPAVLIGRRTLLNGDADSDDDEVDSEAWAAVDRVLKKYDQFKLDGSAEDTGEDTEEDEEEAAERKLQEQMTKWKKTYYKEKLNISYDDPEEMRQITFRYVEGLQWVLHYYYDGVASWGWFYDYHYAPMISDLKDVGSMKFEFELGKPFRPFDQLMGVLPSLSCQHIPEAFRDLMTNPASPIADFYPTNFEADYNGKKQSWEAVVKIPFIDEKRLLAALDSRQGLLSSDEKKRNGFGICVRVKYDENVDELYSSSLPGTFPDIVHSKAKLSEFVLPTLDGLHLVKGLLNGVGLGVKALAGFPSIKTLPHYGRLGFHGVNVFQSDSRQQSIVINVENTFEDSKTEDVAEAYIGNRTFIGWPFLREGIVTAVSDEMFKYEARIAKDRTRRIDKNPHEPWEIGEWKRKSAQIEQRYSKRFGVLIGDVNIVLHVRPMLGLRRMDDGSFLKEYETDPKKELEQAIQVSVASVINEDNRFVERPPLPLPLEFPERSKVFYLGGQAYGSPASIIAISSKQIAIELLLLGDQAKENEFLKSMMARRVPDKYYPSHVVSKRLGISGLALSKMTSSMMLDTDDKRINAGLNLKFEAKGQKVLGYSRRGANGWEYSEKAVRLLADLNGQFPEIAQAVMNNPNKDIRHAKDIFGDRSSARVEQLKVWIKESGVRELEAVPLFAEELDSQTIRLLEQVTGQIAETNRKRARRVMLRGVPRNALLKPAHAPYRLTAQHFALGDRVVYVSNTGNVPLASRGVVVGIQSNFLDLVCDAPFLAGTTLDGRCSAYRGATVAFASVLNLSNMQFVCAQGAAETAEATMATAQTSSGVNLGGKASTGSVHGSALQRTLEASKSGAKTATESAKINGNGSTTAQQQQQSYRPPSFFKAARPQGPNVGTRGAGLRALGNHKAHAANVDSQVPFAGVASGKSRPRPQSNTADALNPLMAALNMGNGAHGRQAGALPSSGGRGGPHQQAGRGRPARGRGRGGAAGQTSS